MGVKLLKALILFFKEKTHRAKAKRAFSWTT